MSDVDIEADRIRRDVEALDRHDARRYLMMRVLAVTISVVAVMAALSIADPSYLPPVDGGPR